MNKLKFLITHCTSTPEGREVTADEIKHWHTDPAPKGNGWSKVGYTDMFHLAGNIENLTPFDQDDDVEAWEITNGVAGVNAISRHIVYVGGKDKTGKLDKDTRTSGQLISLETYYKYQILRHPDILIAGHYQFTNAKKCPCFDVPLWCKKIGIPDKNIYKL